MLTPPVLAAQQHYYGRAANTTDVAERDTLTDEERTFIASRDSFYIATISESGWPYLQHRGGPPGFLQLLDPQTLAFADYGGNRQMLSTGNLATNDRTTLLLMDYPRRERLKILGHARVLDARDATELAARVQPAGVNQTVERIFLIDVVSYDWNCQKFITPRYTREEVDSLIDPLRRRIAELERMLADR
ncbi:MAG TPA: pyridoxamine 5'-phosphate oxidase family protein [Verrucomicrobiae bacterium]|nr:pyridoxamine 5'-phosphate oxidase family protein [Verrucomicrobiae bacterium]